MFDRNTPVQSLSSVSLVRVCLVRVCLAGGILLLQACASGAAPAQSGAPETFESEGGEEALGDEASPDEDLDASAEPEPEVDPEELDDCVMTAVPDEPGSVYVTSPSGWRVKTLEGQEFECSEDFSSVNYRPGLAAIINVQPKGPDAPVAKQVSGFAAAVRDSWSKQHPGQPGPKLLGHKVGRDKRPAVCLELPEPSDEGVKIGCVTAKAGPHDTIVYHYSQFYLKVADFEANKDAAWEAVHDLAGEWTIVGKGKPRR